MTPAVAAAVGAVAAIVAAGMPLLGPAGRTPRRPRTGGAAERAAAAPSGVPWWVEEACRQLRWADLDRVWASVRLAPVAGAAVALIVSGPAAGVVVVAVCLTAPRCLRPGLLRRRLAERDAQLPATVERIASALRAGARPGPAVVDVATNTDGPLGDDLRRVAGDLQRGVALPLALDRWAHRADASADVSLTAAALALGAQAGGQVARAVDGVAATLRERREVQAEVRALATQARSSAWLLAAAPMGFAALVATVEPGAVRFLFTTPVGAICLVAGLTLDALGVGWMARIVRSAA
jgi:tight adherence protein B